MALVAIQCLLHKGLLEIPESRMHIYFHPIIHLLEKKKLKIRSIVMNFYNYAYSILLLAIDEKPRAEIYFENI